LKLGIFGGTFNPVHVGHLINAELIRNEFELDKIIFVPSRLPVHKELDGGISPEDRCNMLSLAIEGNSFMEVSRIEIDRDTPSYMILTLDDLQDKYTGSDFYLIIGSDSYNEIETWKDYRKIFRKTDIIVMKRPGEMIRNKKILFASKRIHIAENPLIQISSTEIRQRIRNNNSIRYMVPDAVCHYIKEKGLY